MFTDIILDKWEYLHRYGANIDRKPFAGAKFVVLK